MRHDCFGDVNVGTPFQKGGKYVIGWNKALYIFHVLVLFIQHPCPFPIFPISYPGTGSLIPGSYLASHVDVSGCPE